MQLQRPIIYLILTFLVLVGRGQEGTVLCLPIYENDTTILDPVRITLKSGFTTSPVDGFYAVIGDGSYTGNTTPPGLPSYSAVSLASPTNRNYIRTTTYREPETNPDAGFNQDEASVDIQYYDGLGRPVQNVSAYATPGKKDLVTYQEYDDFGRVYKQHLPYKKESSDGNYDNTSLSNKNTYYLYSGEFDHWPSDDISATYSKTNYEPSPLNRVLQQGAPGYDWQPTEHPVEYDYLTNTGQLGSFKFNGVSASYFNYPVRSLYITKTTDENDNESFEYKDSEGKLVARIIIDDDNNEVKTLYCYDDFGLLRCVIPPKASKTATPSQSPSIQDLRYYYRYDERKMLVMKKIPDADSITLFYDALDRLVLTQNGNQRNLYNRTYNLYDNLNRLIETGEEYNPTSDNTLRQYIRASTSHIPPSGYHTKHIIYCYDNKTGEFSDASYNYKPETDLYPTNPCVSNNKGRLVGKKIRTSSVTTYIITVYYYDDLGRLVQERKTNPLGGYTTITTVYNFSGQVEHIRYRLTDSGIYYDQQFVYDHRGRLLKTQMNTNGGAYVDVSTNVYNDLGQLKCKYLHSIGGSAALQKIDYKYNVRGWLTHINSPGFDTGGEHDLFGMELVYNDPYRSTFAPNYNGNISGIKWKANANLNYQYDFKYDALNRLNEADFYKWQMDGSEYSTSYSYDMNGNIVDLVRYDKYGDLIDDISNNFLNNSNRINYNTDNSGAGNNPGNGDAEYLPDYPGTSTETFSYDNNGNLTYEPNEDFTVSYNSMNLPSLLEYGGAGSPYKISNFYTFEGEKLRKILDKDGYITVTDYCGPFVYKTEQEQQKIDFIMMPEGRLVNIADAGLPPQWEWQYNLTDHLGNVRVVVKGTNPNNAIVVQENHYYPFGMIMADIGSTYPDYNLENVTQPYLYNGKEYNPELELNWYDYGARFYDPALGRSTTIDPHAETYLSLSPYSMFANNPLLFVDPSGEDIILYAWEQDRNGDWQRKQVQFNQMDSKMQKALEAFAKSDAGFTFLKDFANKGDKIGSVEFSETGKHAKHDMEIAQFDNGGAAYGTSSFREGKDNIIFDMKVNIGRDIENDNAESMAITIGHEAFLHMDQYKDKAIKAFDQNNKEALNQVHEERRNIGKNVEHVGYIRGDQKYSKMRTFVSQLRIILNPAQVDKQIQLHDSKYKK